LRQALPVSNILLLVVVAAVGQLHVDEQKDMGPEEATEEPQCGLAVVREVRQQKDGDHQQGLVEQELEGLDEDDA